MARIPIGEARVGAITPVQMGSSAGLRRAAAADARGAADLEKGATKLGNVLIGLKRQNDANADSIYTNKVLTDEMRWTAENKDRFNQDPATYELESRARQKELLKSAREHVSTEEAMSKLEVGLNQFSTTQYIGFLDTNTKIVRQEAFRQQVETIQETVTFYANQASIDGSSTLYDGLQALRVLQETYEAEAREGGQENIIFPNGDTAVSRTERLFRLGRQQLAGAAISKDAMDLVAAGDLDGAYNSVIWFRKWGVVDLELSPQERVAASNVALSQIALERSSEAQAIQRAGIVLQPHIADRVRALESGEMRADQIVPYILSLGEDFQRGAAAQMWAAAARFDNEIQSQEQVDIMHHFMAEIREDKSWDSLNKVLAEGKKRGLKSTGLGQISNQFTRAENDRMKVAEHGKITLKVAEIMAVEGSPNYKDLDSWLSINQISPEGALKIFNAAMRKYNVDLSAEEVGMISQLRIQVEQTPLQFNVSKVRELLETKGLHDNPAALRSLTNDWWSAYKAQAKAKRDGQFAAKFVNRGQGHPKLKGIQDYFVDMEGQIGIDFKNMTPEQVQAARPVLRELYGHANTLSDQAKTYLTSGPSNAENVQETLARVMFFNDMRNFVGSGPALTLQLDDATQSFYNHIIDNQLRLGEQISPAIQNTIDYMSKTKTDRELDLGNYLGLKEDESVKDWLIDGKRLEGAILKGYSWTDRFVDMLYFGNHIPGPETNPQVFVDAEAMFHNLMKTYPDREVALKEIGRRLQRLYAPSLFSGSGLRSLERHAAEKWYSDTTGSVHYIRWQVAQEMMDFNRAGMPDLPLDRNEWIDGYGEKWFLRPDRQSAASLFSKPTYNIYMRDEKTGTLKMVMSGADPYKFTPKPLHSYDVLMNADLAAEFRGAMELDEGLARAIENVGGAPAFLRTTKMAQDLIHWVKRGKIAEAIKWVEHQFPGGGY